MTHLQCLERVLLLLHVLVDIPIVPHDDAFCFWLCREQVVEVAGAVRVNDMEGRVLA